MPEPQASELRRLHWSALVVRLTDNLRGAAVGAVIFVTTGRLGIVALFVAAGIAATISQHLRFRYAVAADTLLVQGGVLFRWQRVVPFERVQSVEVVQKLVHRVFGVVELRVEAIGSDSTQAKLVALAPADAERLRQDILDRSQPETAEDDSAQVLVKLRPADLVLYGVTGGRVAVLAALLGYVQRVPERGTVTRFFGPLDLWTAALVVGAGVAAVLLLAALISVVLTVFVFWDFTLSREGDRLVVTRGLVGRHRYLVALHRVQAVELRENVARRMLGLASLTVSVAGQAGSSSEVTRSSVIVPVGTRSKVLEIARDALGARFEDLPLQPAPLSALSRRLVGAVVLVAAVTGAAVFFLDGIGYLASLALPAAAGYALAAHRALGHAVGDGYAVVRSGALERQTVLVRSSNVQALHLRIGPTQRPFGLASIDLPPAKGTAVARDLQIELAGHRFDELAATLRPSRT